MKIDLKQPILDKNDRLADGREILYFDDQPHPDRVLVDSRDIPTVAPASEMRFWAYVASNSSGPSANRPFTTQ